MEQNVSTSVLVTGGTGFVGSRLVELLNSRGYAVTCLVRDRENLRWLEGQKVRLVQGDCLDPATLPQAVQGAAMVVHAAGLTKAIRSREYYTVNQKGTENLLEACAAHARGLKKFILVSSLAAAGPADAGQPVSDYGWSKLRAEEAALRFQDRFPVVILRPTAIYGPRDRDVFELFRWAAKGVMLEINGRERFLQWCHVADAAEAVVRAMEHDVPTGSVYCIAEKRVWSLTQFRDTLLRAGGVTARVVTVPAAAAYLMAVAAELSGRIRGRATILNRQKVREAMQRSWTCDVAPAAKDLGFRAAVTLEQGLAMTWSWYREQGWIR